MFTKCCTCDHELSWIFDNFIENFVYETTVSMKVEFFIRAKSLHNEPLIFIFLQN